MDSGLAERVADAVAVSMLREDAEGPPSFGAAENLRVVEPVVNGGVDEDMKRGVGPDPLLVVEEAFFGRMAAASVGVDVAPRVDAERVEAAGRTAGTGASERRFVGRADELDEGADALKRFTEVDDIAPAVVACAFAGNEGAAADEDPTADCVRVLRFTDTLEGTDGGLLCLEDAAADPLVDADPWDASLAGLGSSSCRGGVGVVDGLLKATLRNPDAVSLPAAGADAEGGCCCRPWTEPPAGRADVRAGGGGAGAMAREAAPPLRPLRDESGLDVGFRRGASSVTAWSVEVEVDGGLAPAAGVGGTVDERGPAFGLRADCCWLLGGCGGEPGKGTAAAARGDEATTTAAVEGAWGPRSEAGIKGSALFSLSRTGRPSLDGW